MFDGSRSKDVGPFWSRWFFDAMGKVAHVGSFSVDKKSRLNEGWMLVQTEGSDDVTRDVDDLMPKKRIFQKHV